MDFAESLQLFAKIYKVHENPEQGMRFLYLTVVILAAAVYQMGFARKLPLLKTVIVYLLLAAGATILTLLAVFLPIAEGLAIMAVILVLYKIRRICERLSKKEGESI
ncbi:MAG: YlaH-like family protein [Bacillales bacterium]